MNSLDPVALSVHGHGHWLWHSRHPYPLGQNSNRKVTVRENEGGHVSFSAFFHAF